MGTITKIKTKTHDEWLQLRHKYIGGSDAAAVVGLNPFVSPYSLWAEKTDRITPFNGNLATEVGTYLEDFVAKKFEEETSKKVRNINSSFINSDYPFAIANIDRAVIGEDAGLEIKTTSELNTSKFKGGEFPTQYYCQCVHYMAVTGKSRWYLAVLIGNRDFKIFTIDRDDEEINALMSAESEFYEHIKNNTPPKIDGTQATTDAINTIYAESTDGKSVDLYGIDEAIQEYINCSKIEKEYKKAKDEAANKIKEYMQDAEFGENERYKVLFRQQIRSTFDYKRFAIENPEIDLTSYFNKSNVRPLKVSISK